MPTIENLHTLSPNEALKSLYHNIRQDPLMEKDLKDEGLLRDFGGNLTLDPLTKQPISLEFTSIYHYSEEELRLKSSIWNELFGENGYLTNQTSDKLEQDMNLVELGFALAEYAHQQQMRDKGESWIQHPYRALEKYTKKYKPPAWRVAAFANHDAPEDTLGTDYPYPVTLEDVRNLLGEEAESFIRRLTKIRKIQKRDGQDETVTDRVETIFNLLKALGEEDVLDIGKENGMTTPVDIAYKIAGDVKDNAETLSGKDPKDRVNIASAYFELYPPLAKRLGLDEGEIIADRCYEVLDEDAHRDGLVYRLRQGIEEHLTPINTDSLVSYTEEKLKAHQFLGFKKFTIKKPGVFAIGQAMDGRRNPEENDFFLKGTVVLDDSTQEDEKGYENPELGFYSRALQTLISLSFANNYQVSDETVEQIKRVLTINKEKPNIDLLEDLPVSYKAVIDGKEKLVPIKLSFKRKSDYDLETTPITYLEAVDLTDDDKKSQEFTLEERKKLAQVKRERIAEEFRSIVNDPGLTKEEKIRSVRLTLPDSILVTDLKTLRFGKEERLRNPVPKNSTVLDYALLRIPGSWQRLNAAIVNGEEIKDFGRVLKEGDHIQLTFGKKNENNVRASWLDKLNVDPENSRKAVAKELEKSIRETTGKKKKEGMIKEVRHRGWNIINSKVENLDQFGLSYGQKAFPDPNMSPRDFAYEVGLEKVTRGDIERVGSYLKNFWHNLTTLRIRISKANVPGKASEVLEVIKNSGINMVNLASASKWGDTASLMVKIDKSDPSYNKLRVAIKDLRVVLGYDTLIFEDETQHQKWLAEFEADVD